MSAGEAVAKRKAAKGAVGETDAQREERESRKAPQPPRDAEKIREYAADKKAEFMVGFHDMLKAARMLEEFDQKREGYEPLEAVPLTTNLDSLLGDAVALMSRFVYSAEVAIKKAKEKPLKKRPPGRPKKSEVVEYDK